MRKYVWTPIVIILTMGLFQNNALSGELFLWGTVKWNTGTPAVGLEIRLIKDETIVARTYSNQAGRYGFFEIQGYPSQYSLEVFYSDDRLNSMRVPDLPRGGKVPDIVVQ